MENLKNCENCENCENYKNKIPRVISPVNIKKIIPKYNYEIPPPSYNEIFGNS